MLSSWQFQLSSHSTILPLYSSPLFISTVTICPVASCRSFTGMPKLRLMADSSRFPYFSVNLTLLVSDQWGVQLLLLWQSLNKCLTTMIKRFLGQILAGSWPVDQFWSNGSSSPVLHDGYWVGFSFTASTFFFFGKFNFTTKISRDFAIESSNYF